MDVTFATGRLQDAYEDEAVGTREWGQKVARVYIRRVGNLYAATTAQDLRDLRALKFHALKGERAGQYAMSLDRSWRLIVTFQNDEMTIVRVEEVSNHYDD